MSQDEHRAPNRLASSSRYHRWHGSSSSSSRHRARRPQPRAEYEIVATLPADYDAGYEYSERPYDDPAANETDRTGSGAHHFNEPPVLVPPAETEAVPSYRAEPDPAPLAPPEPTGRMSTQDQYQLLIHNIRLCGDEWKLAGIRANKKLNWLTAYLIPSNKRIELKEALRRQMVMMITIDEWGNTDVKEPRRRSIWRALTSWFYSE